MRDRNRYRVLFFLVVLFFLGCGPNKQVLRLQREVARLQQEKQAEVARLQKEKFEAMQVRRVALERQQKMCRAELKHLRWRHRELSFKVAKASRKAQRLLSQILSDVLLMPFHQDDAPNEPKASTPAASTPAAGATVPQSPPAVRSEPAKPAVDKKADKDHKGASK